MPGPQQRILVDGIEFGRVFRFPRILRAMTAGMQPPRLVVALLMVVALVAVGRLWDQVTGPSIPAPGLVDRPDRPTEPPDRVIRDALAAYGLAALDDDEPRSVRDRIEAAYGVRRGELVSAEDRRGADDRYRALRARLDAVSPRGTFAALTGEAVDDLHAVVRGILVVRPEAVFAAGERLFVGVPVGLWRADPAFVVAYGLFALVVLAIGGGALCRMAACDAAGAERLRVREAIDFALGNWVKLVLTPSLPLVVAGILAAVIAVVGVLLAPWIGILGGPLYGVSLLLGFVLAFMLLGYAFAFPLLIPAVAVENCDAGDAQQRAYAYLLNRPFHLLGYTVVAVFGLAVGYVVVSIVAVAMLDLTASLSGAITGGSALGGAGGVRLFDLAPRGLGSVHASWHERWTAGSIGFWERVVVDLVAAWVVSYLFTAATHVYLLMRWACDGQDVEEIWRPGLTPGTLVPIPSPRVETADADDEPAPTTRGFGSASESEE